jgi:N4-gp56 family major capsid protein
MPNTFGFGTDTTGFSSTVHDDIQKAVVETLRAGLVSLPRGAVVPAVIIAQSGTNFTLRSTSYPDLVDTTPTDPLTEGVAPAALKLGIDTQDWTVQQTGARTVVTDIAQLQSPHDLTKVAQEKISRLAAEKIDAIGRAALTALTTTNDYLQVLDSYAVNDMVAIARAADLAPINGVGYYAITHPNVLAGLAKEDGLNGYNDLIAQVGGGDAITKGAVAQYKGLTFLTSTKYTATAGNYPLFIVSGNSIAAGDISSMEYVPWTAAGVGNELGQLKGFGFKAILGAEVLDLSTTADGAGTNATSVPRVLRFGFQTGVSGF